MNITTRHRRVARTVWECGGRLDEAAEREGIRPDTLRGWLADPKFRREMAQDALEPLLQATSAVMRWAPVAVARLIKDLESESAADARQAAREILKLALDTQRELSGGAAPASRDTADDSAAPPQDPLGQRIAALTDAQLAAVLRIINGGEI